jgi:hypothetical protein
MPTMPIAGQFMDKRGPGKIVLVSVTLILCGMGTFAFGVWQEKGYVPVLLVGLSVMGMGMGCERMGTTHMARCCQHLCRSHWHRVLSDPASTLGGRRHDR